MAIFEKRSGAPAGVLNIQTDNNSYSISDGGTLTATEADDIAVLRDHPFLQLQGGTGGPYVAPPVISDVYLMDGVLMDGRTNTPVGVGIELGSAEWGSNFTASSTAAEDVPAASISIVERARPYYVEVRIYSLSGSTASQSAHALLTDGANVVLDTATWLRSTANQGGMPATLRYRASTPVPGTAKTYKVRTLGSGTCIPSVSAAPTARGTIRAIEV